MASGSKRKNLKYLTEKKSKNNTGKRLVNKDESEGKDRGYEKYSDRPICAKC